MHLFKAAEADCFMKAVQHTHALSGSTRVEVHNSTITGHLKDGRGTFQCSLVKAIGKGLDLLFVYEKEKFNAMRSFRRSKGNIRIISQDCYYEMTDNKTTVRHWKCGESSPAPVFHEASTFNMIGVPVTFADLEMVKKADRSPLTPFVYLTMAKGQLNSLTLPSGISYCFDADAYDEKVGSSTVDLKSLSILLLPGKEATLSIGEKEGDYWLLTKTEIALGAELEVQEPLLMRRN